MEIIDGRGEVKQVFRNSVKHSYFVNILSDNALVKDNTVYFPAWTVYVNNQIVPIQFQNPQQRGIITFDLKKGESRVDVMFKDTKLRIFSNVLSLLTLTFLIVAFFIIRIRYEK